MAGHYPIIKPSALLPGGFVAAAPGKVNRFLHVLGRLPDSYHLLETGFQFLNWCDWIHVRKKSIPGIQILHDPLRLNQSNLVYKAAEKLLHQTELGVEILIEKHLPTGGGLGGGSSDAATTLVVLNHIFDLGLNQISLQKIGIQLGADIPVFIFGQSCLAKGIGEIFEAIEWPGKRVLIVDPQIIVSTKLIFQHPKLTRDTPSCSIRAVQLDTTRNDCEAVVRFVYPKIDRLIEGLKVFGDPRLTGTGGCVFVVDPSNRFSTQDIVGDLGVVKESLLNNRSMLYTSSAVK